MVWLTILIRAVGAAVLLVGLTSCLATESLDRPQGAPVDDASRAALGHDAPPPAVHDTEGTGDSVALDPGGPDALAQRRYTKQLASDTAPHPEPRPFAMAQGDAVWVWEQQDCKGADESWQTLFRGRIEALDDERVTVRLQDRFGFWFDRREAGYFEGDWWCIPRRRYCGQQIGFSDWGGQRREGERGAFERPDVMPVSGDLRQMISDRFQQQCAGGGAVRASSSPPSLDNRRHAASPVRGPDAAETAQESRVKTALDVARPLAAVPLPVDQQEAIRHLISRHHYRRPSQRELAGCCATLADLETSLRALDPYSAYRSGPAATGSDNPPKLRYSLGLSVVSVAGRLLAVPFARGPAATAGFYQPAWINAIDGVAFSDMSPARWSQLAGLEAGQEVPIDVSRGGSRSVFNLVASPITPPQQELFEHADVTLLRIHEFDDAADGELRLALVRAEQRGKPLVIDLRYCVGGSLYGAVDALSLLLDAGLTVTTLRRNGGAAKPLKTLSGRLSLTLPVAVWVSPVTGSAAEIFVRALQKHDPAVAVVGSETAGKCLAQQVLPLNAEASLKLSVYELEDASGIRCQGSKIRPGLYVPPEEFWNDQPYLNFLKSGAWQTT